MAQANRLFSLAPTDGFSHDVTMTKTLWINERRSTFSPNCVREECVAEGM